MVNLIIYTCLLTSVGYGQVYPISCGIRLDDPYYITFKGKIIRDQFELIIPGKKTCVIDSSEDVCTFTVLPYGPVIVQSGIGVLDIEVTPIEIKNIYLPIFYDN